MDAPAAHRNVSDGSLAVCSSIAFAIGPSDCLDGVVISLGIRVRQAFGWWRRVRILADPVMGALQCEGEADQRV